MSSLIPASERERLDALVEATTFLNWWLDEKYDDPVEREREKQRVANLERNEGELWEMENSALVDALVVKSVVELRQERLDGKLKAEMLKHQRKLDEEMWLRNQEFQVSPAPYVGVVYTDPATIPVHKRPLQIPTIETLKMNRSQFLQSILQTEQAAPTFDSVKSDGMNIEDDIEDDSFWDDELFADAGKLFDPMFDQDMDVYKPVESLPQLLADDSHQSRESVFADSSKKRRLDNEACCGDDIHDTKRFCPAGRYVDDSGCVSGL
ncbi:hypothetical protein BT69DRAFT_1281713 [Atractiella rhizophila]|nr:hypothetical protein BT69DRAFT_1281713 [Atractiella rhizophila]